MLSEKEILDELDYSNERGYYWSFIKLNEGYSYLIDCRLNIFCNNDGRWAIAAERLGYNPRAGRIMLDIKYFGNCLINLEHYNGQDTNYYSVMPVDDDSFFDSIDGEALNKDAKYWNVRGKKVKLIQLKADYESAGISLNEYEPDEISVQEAARLVVLKHSKLFRATDQELYKSIPTDLKKILVLDEWYHRDFVQIINPRLDDKQLRVIYESNKRIANRQDYMDYESYVSLFRKQEEKENEFNKEQWEFNRPSSYETWKQIARVIVKCNPSHYKPTLEANTHWKYYPESGNL